MSENRLTSPPANEPVLSGVSFALNWWQWVSRVTRILQGREPAFVREYTVATLPDAADWKGAIVAVSDEAGGYCLALSDGVIWRRSYDNAEVST